MSAKLGTVWSAEPHTIAKIEMLKSYLFQWFSILGSKFRGKDLWYIDGFAGPGEYSNHRQGSPLAAIEAANQARAAGRWVAGNIHCLFIEEDAARFANLNRLIQEEAPRIDGVFAQTFHGTFVDGVAKLKSESINPFRSAAPLFAFIDPFGPSGMSFRTVKELLSRPTCEVLVNFDSDGISRIYQAGVKAQQVHREILDDVFGGSDWEPQLGGLSQHQEILNALAIYKAQLRTIPGVKYTFSFEMRKQNHVFDYHLVFASQNALGLEKMKETMKRIDKSGSYCFSDSKQGQAHLFAFDNPEDHSHQLVAQFAGRTVSYEDISDFTLNETPFTNPKAMLAALEEAGRIIVHCNVLRSRKTFPERTHATMKIEFKERN